MKRKYRVFTIVLMLTLSCNAFAQDKKTIRENSIKVITVYEKKAGKGNVEQVESITTYDKNGNVLEEKEYNSEGKLKNHKQYAYDGEGNKIKETELDENGKTIETANYKYLDGLKIEKNVTDGKGGFVEKKRYVYSKFE